MTKGESIYERTLLCRYFNAIKKIIHIISSNNGGEIVIMNNNTYFDKIKLLLTVTDSFIKLLINKAIRNLIKNEKNGID